MITMFSEFPSNNKSFDQVSSINKEAFFGSELDKDSVAFIVGIHDTMPVTRREAKNEVISFIVVLSLIRYILRKGALSLKTYVSKAQLSV